ncbi:helicase-related protein [Vibrio sp. 10N.247.311.12]|uniref:helicase-related protein n=1 Tax=Vibrio sp. 10N.247.311.12 TaxID=3229991 RepID=UPI00354CE640
MEINLSSSEYLSDKADLMPSSSGLYLINAGTGVGKTFYMTNQSHLHNDVVVFPQKSILVQQELKAKQEGRSLNLLQLEHFISKGVNDFIAMGCKAIHVDEIQLIYECGYRDVAVSGLYYQLKRLSKHFPVYCYSGTYKQPLSPIEFQWVDVNKTPPKREVVLFHTTAKKDSDTQSHNGFTNELLVNCINNQFKESGKPVLFFNNNHHQNEELAKVLLKEFNLRSVAVNRDSVRDSNHPFQDLAKKEFIKDMECDVVLATSALEEGINVNDSVCVISVQTAGERLVQQFGRARNANLATYVLICGIGDGEITDSKAMSISQSSIGDGFDKEKSRQSYGIGYKENGIKVQEVRDCCCARSVQVTRLQRPKYGLQVIKELESYGYTIDTTRINEYEKQGEVKLPKIKKSQIIELLKTECANLDELIEQGIGRVVIDVAISRAKSFKEKYDSISLGKSERWLDAYENLSGDAIIYMLSINDDDINNFRGPIEKIRQRKPRLTPEQLDKVSDWFWGNFNADGSDSWLEDGANKSRSKLFRWLAGYRLDKSNNVYIVDDSIDEWWLVKVDRKKQQQLSRHKKTLKENNLSIGEICNATNNNQNKIAHMSKKQLSELIGSM